MDQSLSALGGTYGRFLRIFGCVLAGMVLGAALMWLGVYVYHDGMQARSIDRLNLQLKHTQAELNDLYAQRNALEGSLAVESSTRQGLERSLATTQQELGVARDQIAFFNELLPPGPDGSISIRALDVQQQGGMLHFRVLLMRHGARDLPFDGTLQFEASGRIVGDPVSITLEPVRARDAGGGPPSNSVLALRFDQFQRSSGLLQIPEGIELEHVTLNVFEGETLRVSRTIDVPAQRLPH